MDNVVLLYPFLFSFIHETLSLTHEELSLSTYVFYRFVLLFLPFKTSAYVLLVTCAFLSFLEGIPSDVYSLVLTLLFLLTSLLELEGIPSDAFSLVLMLPFLPTLLLEPIAIFFFVLLLILIFLNTLLNWERSDSHYYIS